MVIKEYNGFFEVPEVEPKKTKKTSKQEEKKDGIKKKDTKTK
jgi:hypothetical protein